MTAGPPEDPQREHRRVTRPATLGWAAVALLAAAVAVVTLQPSWWSGALVGAQVSPFRLGQAIVMVAAAGLVAPALRWRAPRRHVAAVLAVLVLGAVGHVAVLADRGWTGSGATGGRNDPTPATVAASVDDGRLPDDVVVLSFNTFGRENGSQIADLAVATEADVIVLPETSAATAAETADQLAGQGVTMTVLTWDPRGWPSSPTAMLVRSDLGDYSISRRLDTRSGAFVATAPDGSGTAGSRATGIGPLAAGHPIAPVSASLMGTWRDETAQVAGVCGSTPGMIMAGDFNATLDHPGLRDLAPCVDAAAEAGAAAVGTWPAHIPSVLAAPIDHVLVDGRAWQVVAFHVLPAVGDSDHRPIVAVLRHR